jgi:hypothetical protein
MKAIPSFAIHTHLRRFVPIAEPRVRHFEPGQLCNSLRLCSQGHLAVATANCSRRMALYRVENARRYPRLHALGLEATPPAVVGSNFPITHARAQSSFP